MRRSIYGAWPATHNSGSPSRRHLRPHRAARRAAMADAVRHAAQRHDGAFGKGRGFRQPPEPRRDPAAVLLRKGARLLDRAARRYGQNDFARRRLDAQRIAARLAMPLEPHRIDRSVECDLDRLRLARAAKEQRALRHGRVTPTRHEWRREMRQRTRHETQHKSRPIVPHRGRYGESAGRLRPKATSPLTPNVPRRRCRNGACRCGRTNWDATRSSTG